MPLAYIIDARRRLVRLRYTDDPTFDEWATVMREVLEHPDYTSGFSFLVDRRGAVAPTRDYIRRAVDFTKGHRVELDGTKWALVVDGAEAYARASMAQILQAGAFDVRVFTDAKEAEDWLDEGQLGGNEC
jgi:hypothetical protein